MDPADDPQVQADQQEDNSDTSSQTSSSVSSSDSDNEAATTTQDTSSSYRARILQLLKCPVCSETVTEPKGLNCCHFFCSECLKILAGDSGLVVCPQCSADTQLGDDGAVNHDLAIQLLELLQTVEEDLSPPPPAIAPADVAAPATAVITVDNEMQTDEVEAQPEPQQPETTEVEIQTEVEEPPPPEPQVEVTPPQAPVTNNAEIQTEVDEPAPPEPQVEVTPPAAIMTDAEIQTEVEESTSPEPQPELETPAVADTTAEIQTETELTQPNVPAPTEPPVEAVVPAAAMTNGNGEVMSDTTSETHDDVDRGMTAAEVKATEMKVNTAEETCPTCMNGGGKEACNCNSLLTPPASEHSVEMNVSQTASQGDDTEIIVQQHGVWKVTDSASHIEVVKRDRIIVSRWTYDGAGSIATFKSDGEKYKWLHGCKGNYTGVTMSKLGFIFTINSSKDKIEEYNPKDGRKLRSVKIEYCRDPHAIDVTKQGVILVADQERNRIVKFYKSQKPGFIEHELLKEPHDICATQSGVIVTCARTKCVLHLSLNSELIWAYGVGSTEGKLNQPRGVCQAEDGQIYVVDNEATVIVLNENGECVGHLVEKSMANLGTPWYISVRDNMIAILNSHNVVRTYTKTLL